MRIRLQLYGWYIPTTRQFRLSRFPQDAPVRPSILFDTMAEVMEYRDRKKASILWWPPLPQEATNSLMVGEAS